MRAAALAILGAATAGCTWNAQPLYAGSSPAPLKLSIATNPAPDADGLVTQSAVVVLQFDDFPDPDSVAMFGPVQLRSGGASFDLDITTSLVDKQMILTPRSLLAPNGQYTVVVQPGLSSLGGRTLQSTVSQTVQVGLDQGARPSPPPAYTWKGTIATDIATCAPSCHSTEGASGDTRTPTRLLDLTGDPANPTYGLINVLAQGELDWPAPLLRVSPGDSAHSVLLRKLLGGNPLEDSRDANIPDTGVDGRRMPIQLDDTQATPPPLDTQTIRRVQNWIDEGAPIS